MGPAAWFARSKSPLGQHAITICNSCPVKRECLEEANRLELHQIRPVGIWGGLAPYARRDLVKEQRAAGRTGQHAGEDEEFE
jgi:hypothetical protein